MRLRPPDRHKAANPMPLATNISSFHIFQILRLMRRDPTARNVAEVSRRVGLAPSTVHRAVSTLEEADFLRRSENGSGYEIGVMPQMLARALFNRFAIRKACLPYLRRLVAATLETTTLSVR